jgi:hypothetical protein
VTDCLTGQQPANRLAFLLSGDLEITPTPTLDGKTPCEFCEHQPALAAWNTLTVNTQELAWWLSDHATILAILFALFTLT